MKIRLLPTGQNDRIAAWILLGWTLVNLLQAAFTGLHEDEAYYWVWSRFPDWGYFDHPPMVAMWIRAGYGLLQNELGVRLVFVLAHSATLWGVYHLSGRKSPVLLFSILFGGFLIHAGGFFAAPDIPLQFFAVMFLLALRQYVSADQWKWALALGIIIPLMLASKYHGILLILFTLLYYPRILTRKTFWGIAVLALVLFSPVIYWQVVNDYPTAHYFLGERPGNSGAPLLESAGGYLLGVVILGGLFHGGWVLWLAAKRPAEAFSRYLRFLWMGILGFFFLFSLRGPIEINWTALAMMPIALLTTEQVAARPKIRTWVVGLSLASCAVLMGLRLAIAFPQWGILPSRTDEFTDWTETYRKAKGLAGEGELLAKTYQAASKLSFYAPPGSKIVPPMGIQVRSNQFDFWDLDQDLEAGPVALLDQRHRWKSIACPTAAYPHGWIRNISYFVSFREVDITPVVDSLSGFAGDTIEVLVQARNLRPIHFSGLAHVQEKYGLSYHIGGIDTFYIYKGIVTPLSEAGLEGKPQTMRVALPQKPGEYGFYPDIWTRHLFWWDAGKPVSIPLRVKKKPLSYR